MKIISFPSDNFNERAAVETTLLSAKERSFPEWDASSFSIPSVEKIHKINNKKKKEEDSASCTFSRQKEGEEKKKEDISPVLSRKKEASVTRKQDVKESFQPSEEKNSTRRYELPSSQRKKQDVVRLLAFHSMETRDIEESLFILTAKEPGVSAHYLIDGNGAVYALVDESKRAWHAGISAWREFGKDLNSFSIGIEFQNTGGKGFSPVQIQSGIELSKEILKRHPFINPAYVVAHSDIAPLRKKDPGEEFPWALFAQNGIGLWTEAKTPSNPDYLQKTEEELLFLIGYRIPASVRENSEEKNKKTAPIYSSFSAPDRPTLLGKTTRRGKDKIPLFSSFAEGEKRLFVETKEAFLTAFCRRFAPLLLKEFTGEKEEKPLQKPSALLTEKLFCRLAAIAELYDLH